MDFIDGFLDYSDGIASPEGFRLWAAIAAVSGALERRVYTITTGKPAYANLIVLLVGPPGTGKSESINIVEELWVSQPDFKVAPNNVTKAALIDALFEARRNILIDNTTLLDFHSLLVAAPEFGVLVPAHDLEFLSVINYIWDCPKFYREKRRGLKDMTNLTGEVDISKPQICILAGTQPGYLSSLLPEEAWTMGTMSRTIMVYSGSIPDVPLFDAHMRDERKMRGLEKEIKRISNLCGAMSWSIEAMRAAEAWRKTKLAPVPTHTKLVHFNARRMFTTIKLCMIACAARGDSMKIELEDFERAKGWLLEAESKMADVFRDMANKSDRAIIEELYHFAWAKFMQQRSPIHESLLATFLMQRIPENKVQGILRLMEQTAMLENKGQSYWEPRPYVVNGVE